MHSITNIFTKDKTISSLEVAEMMGISHKELLRKLNGSTDRKGIYSILAENQMEPSIYFVPSAYTDGSEKENPVSSERHMVFYSQYSDLGYEEIKQEILDSGKVIYHRRITQIGREFILDLLSADVA